jgi:hypothetical protein
LNAYDEEYFDLCATRADRLAPLLLQNGSIVIGTGSRDIVDSDGSKIVAFSKRNGEKNQVPVGFRLA